MTEAYELFRALPKIERALRALLDVGLGYLRLGQPSTTLSGGEAQRVKLASELQRPATGRTLYLLDEPTTGLHFEDIRKLLAAVQQLVDAGNTVVVIEHNLDVVKCADWVLDLGPEGGARGGRLVAEGTPEHLVAEHGDSSTGQALAELLKRRKPPKAKKAKKRTARAQAKSIEVRGASMHNLQKVDVDIPLGQFTVVSGPSGSGKSSLAFDTLFREGQRRFVESLSTYARRFLGRMDRAPVERLDGIGPAIAIDQRSSHRSARSTVATATEIHDYLRLLYARIGRSHCPEHGHELVLHAPGSIARKAASEWADRKGYVLAPFVADAESDEDGRRRWLDGLTSRWRESGFVRVMVDGVEHRLDGDPVPLPSVGDEVRLIVDRVAFKQRGRVVDSAAQAAEQTHGVVVLRTTEGEERRYTTDRSCPDCGFSVPAQPHPRFFSFNHHSGACTECGGLGEQIVCVPELLINRPHKPLFGGAIDHKGRGFTFLNKRSGWHQKIARALAKNYDIDLSVPFEQLPAEHVELLLRGGVDDRFSITFQKRRSGSSHRFQVAAQWKGLLRIVEDWFHGAGEDGGSEEKRERLHAVMRRAECRACEGDRLQPAQRHVLVGGKSLPQISKWTVAETAAFFDRVRLRKPEREVAEQVLVEVRNRLGFLQSVGLEYLTLDRSAATLSGGEAQRIRLATQLGNRLVGVLYVLDEPTVGLHPRDTQRLLDTLTELRDLGNTVVAVEHDEQMIRAADHLVDVGPGSGRHGGKIVASGTPAAVAKAGIGLTAEYLGGGLVVEAPPERRTPTGRIELRGADAHNLRSVDLDIPLGVMTAVTGVSGSGKSSLVLEELLPRLQDGAIEAHSSHGESIEPPSVVFVDQSPVGTTPSSNPATYVGVMTPIRELYAALPQARVKGFKSGRFSFNVASGRCAACEGKGQLRVEMHFLADVWVTCEICSGRRYNQETLEVEYRGKTIADVLAMECAEAREFFGNHPRIARPLQALCDVGLGYLSLGQAANTLSGGEAQRIKLVSRLAARSMPVQQIYLLDEPTTGLHVDDVRKLMAVLQRLVDGGDTVVVIEHHLDVIRCADHVVELGPEAGAGGGRVIATGSPEQLAAAQTPTAPFLAAALAEAGRSSGARSKAGRARASGKKGRGSARSARGSAGAS